MEVLHTAFGAESYRSLVAVVRHLKDGDPLRPVTVLVPSEHVGVAARRALARGDGRPGVAAVQVLTVRRLAESLAAGELAAEDRRPLTTITLAATVREVLRGEPGLFAPVAGQIGTVRALARAHRALRSVRDPEAVAQGVAVAEDTVRVHRAVERRLTAYDEVDLLRRATAHAGARSGPVVAFLLRDLDPAEQDLLAAVGDLTVVDAPEPEPAADRVVHASDPDDEVRAAVRDVLAALRAGVPGHRIAVLHGSVDPYARLLHEHLDRAGVTFFGRGVRPSLDTPFGRGFLRMLALPDHGFRRDEVLAWLTDCPVRFRSERAPSSRWERVSRAAGVVRDGHWDRLRTYAEERRERVPAAAADADGLRAFVDGLRARFADLDAATGWEGLAAAAHALWAPVTDGAPHDDRALRRIDAALDAIGNLTGDGDPTVLRELVELQLADDLDRTGTIGIGVHVGPVADGYGEHVETVIVVGAAEGVLPARIADDPLLPDRVRRRSGGALPTTAEQTARRRRDFHVALAAAPPGGRTVLYPRGDLRGGGSRVPSRWLAPILHGGVEPIELPSYAGTLLSADPATEQEWRQRRAVATDGVDDLTDALVDRRRERCSHRLTPHSGRVAGAPDPTAQAISPSQLEMWATCPWHYFLTSVLGVRPVEQPEDVIRISPRDRGSLMHDALEGLVLQSQKEGWAPGPHEPWPARSWEALEQLARAEFRRAEAEGRTGFPLLWREDGAALLADLRHWLVQDDARRERHGGLVALAAEWEFGGGAGPDVEIDLGDGRMLRVTGTIDRVDADPAGRLVVVDYKSGRRPSPDPRPWGGGTRLQLPIYALAAAAHFLHTDGEPVRSSYWYTSRRGTFAEEEIELDDATRASATETITAVVDGIANGVFPARPTKHGGYYQGRPTTWVSCRSCDPDGLGESVHPRWEQLADDPWLRSLPTVHRLLFGEEAS